MCVLSLKNIVIFLRLLSITLSNLCVCVWPPRAFHKFRSHNNKFIRSVCAYVICQRFFFGVIFEIFFPITCKEWLKYVGLLIHSDQVWWQKSKQLFIVYKYLVDYIHHPFLMSFCHWSMALTSYNYKNQLFWNSDALNSNVLQISMIQSNWNWSDEYNLANSVSIQMRTTDD